MNLLRIILFSRTALFGGGDATPGGAAAAILMENGNGIALESGSGVILME